jgi:hypothetical protein
MLAPHIRLRVGKGGGSALSVPSPISVEDSDVETILSYANMTGDQKAIRRAKGRDLVDWWRAEREQRRWRSLNL